MSPRDVGLPISSSEVNNTQIGRGSEFPVFPELLHDRQEDRPGWPSCRKRRGRTPGRPRRRETASVPASPAARPCRSGPARGPGAGRRVAEIGRERGRPPAALGMISTAAPMSIESVRQQRSQRVERRLVAARRFEPDELREQIHDFVLELNNSRRLRMSATHVDLLTTGSRSRAASGLESVPRPARRPGRARRKPRIAPSWARIGGSTMSSA